MPLNTASDPRISQLQAWLATLSQTPTVASSLRPASSDASFRRYFRIDSINPNTSYIVMDAPPPQENVQPFVAIAKLFDQAGVNVPQVLASDVGNGFLLLSDLGSTTYLQELTSALSNTPRQDQIASNLYGDAIDALITLQSYDAKQQLPEYDRAMLLRELMLFPDWYLGRHRNIQLNDAQQTDLNKAFDIILANNLAQGKVIVHRDYHSRNLMFLANNNPGILDFQDAVFGPITYDLVSLLRDAYITWDEEQVLDWAIRYWEKAKRKGLPINPDVDGFYRDFEFMSLQRHLKVLGIFARLYYRDGKEAYLNDIPVVLNYVQKTARRYSELGPLIRILNLLEQTQVGYTF